MVKTKQMATGEQSEPKQSNKMWSNVAINNKAARGKSNVIDSWQETSLCQPRPKQAAV